ncbi:MAG: YfiR family protein [Azoarcus sp.]|jgi:hypothetical protein|nr:YfiR family protein [Azoarcus sp.]
MPRPARKLPHCLLSALLGLAVLVFAGNARTADAAVPTRASKVATVVWGIISYTRWSGEQKSLRICLPEDSAYAVAIRESAKVVTPGRPVVVRTTPPDAATACDVVYFHDISSEEASHLLKTFIGAPVLTIGEGRAFCTAGGMFCLLPGSGGETEGGGARFAVNLDATSRSHLRISPQVLKLSKHGRER